MQIKLPIEYNAWLRTKRGTEPKEHVVFEEIEVEVVEFSSEDFPVAARWQVRNLPWETGPTSYHTRYAGGMHWAFISDEPALEPSNGAIANLYQLSKVLPGRLVPSLKTANAISDNQKTVRKFGATYPIALASAIDVSDLFEDDKDNRHEALMQAHLLAAKLASCDGKLYFQTVEPRLRLLMANEKQPPNSIALYVDDGLGFPDKRFEPVPSYDHRLDRLADFASVAAEWSPPGDNKTYDLIEDVEVLIPESIKLDDDNAAYQALVQFVKTGLSTVSGSGNIQEVVSLYRKFEDKEFVEDKTSALALLEAKMGLFSGRRFDDLRHEIRMINERWALRPVTGNRL